MAGWWRSFWTYFFIIFVAIIAIIITFITTFIDEMFEHQPVFYPPVAVVPAGDMGGGFLDALMSTAGLLLPFLFALAAAALAAQWLYNYLFGPRSTVRRRRKRQPPPPRDGGDSGLGGDGDDGLGDGDGDDDSSSSAVSIERALKEEQERDNRDWAKSRHPIVGAHIAFHPPEKMEGPRKTFAPIKKPPQDRHKMYLKPSSVPRELSSTLMRRQKGRVEKVGPTYRHSKYLRERAKRRKARRARRVARRAKRAHMHRRAHKRPKSQETSPSSQALIDRESRAGDGGQVLSHVVLEEELFKIPTFSDRGHVEASPEHGELAPRRHHHRLVDAHRKEETHATDRGRAEGQADEHLKVPSLASSADLPRHHRHRHHRGLLDAHAVRHFKDTIDGQKTSDDIQANIPSTGLNDYHGYEQHKVDPDPDLGIPLRSRAHTRDEAHFKVSSDHVDLGQHHHRHEHRHDRDDHVLGARAKLEKQIEEKKKIRKKKRKKRKKKTS